MAFCTSSWPATRPSRSLDGTSKSLKRRIVPGGVRHLLGAVVVHHVRAGTGRRCAPARRGSLKKRVTYSSKERMDRFLTKSRGHLTARCPAGSAWLPRRLSCVLESWPIYPCHRATAIARWNTGTFPSVRQMSRALLALLLLAALSGCPPASSAPCVTDSECPEGRCRFGGCGPMCLDDTDCAAGQACYRGRLRASPRVRRQPRTARRASPARRAGACAARTRPVPPTRCAARAGARTAAGAPRTLTARPASTAR